MRAPGINKLKKSAVDVIADWVNSEYKIEISYPEVTDKIIHMIFEDHVQSILKKNKWEKDYSLTFPKSSKKSKRSLAT